MRLIVFASATSLFALSSPAFAADAAAKADATAVTAASSAVAAELDETVIVQGERGPYGVKRTSSATRTDTEIKDIPQALTVITEDQIEDQQLRSIADVLTFVPGVMPGTGEGNRDQFTLRGNNTTADLFRDGIRDDVQYFRDLYNVSRVEVLKGPNAMIFGRGGGGGVVNRVTKRSSLDARRELAILGDSEGGYRFTADLDQPLATNVGVRLNAMYEDGESFRRNVELERYGFNPTVGILAGPLTRIDIGYEYLRDRRTVDRGVPAFNDEPIRGFQRSFFGDPDNSFSRAAVHVGNVGIEQDLGGGLTLRNRTLVGAYDKYYQNVYPAGLDEASGVVSLAAYSLRTDRDNLFSQTDLAWAGRLAGIDQTLLLGFEIGRQNSRNRRRAAAGSTATLDDPTVERPILFLGDVSNNRTRADTAALYVQDQIQLSPMLGIVAGLRFERFRLSVNDLRPADVDHARTETMLSPRLGVILKPKADLSLYASYSRSFLPQSGDQFASLDATTDSLKPERFDNYEIGAKWEPVPGLLATAALYQLDRSNTRARDQADLIVLTGSQRSRGLELGLERSVTDRWLISAGYAWQDAEITKTTTAAPEGRKVPLVPKHSFSLWNRYDVTNKLGLGLGIVARSKAYASISNQVKLPGYARVDAAAYYDLGRGIEAQLNVENLFDADYFSTAHNDNNIAPGAPFTVKGGLRFNF